MYTEKYFVLVFRTGGVGRLYTDTDSLMPILRRGDTVVVRNGQLATLLGDNVAWIDIAETKHELLLESNVSQDSRATPHAK